MLLLINIQLCFTGSGSYESILLWMKIGLEVDLLGNEDGRWWSGRVKSLMKEDDDTVAVIVYPGHHAEEVPLAESKLFNTKQL